MAALLVVLDHSWNGFRLTIPPIIAPFTIGRIAVDLFFLLSGFVLSIGYFRMRDPRLVIHMALRRYIRLTIPIFASMLLAFACARYWPYAQDASFYVLTKSWLYNSLLFDLDIGRLFTFSLADVYVDSRESYNIAYWTMHFEMIGSFAIFLTLIIYPYLARPWIVYPFVILFCVIANSMVLLFFVGMGIADLYSRGIIQRWQQHWLATPLGILGIVLFCALCKYYFVASYSQLYSAGIFISIIMVRPLLRLFATRPMRVLGELSFPLYLTHMLVISSVVSLIFIHANQAGITGMPLLIIMLVSTFFFTLLVALCFLPVERFAIWLSHMFSNWCMKPASERDA